MNKDKKGKILEGVIVSDKMDKTVVVLVKRYVKHRRYGKYLNLSKKYKAHDEKNEYKTGDAITIKECKPISKDKSFEVVGKK